MNRLSFYFLLSCALFFVINPASANEADPWENWNRKVFQFNETVDYYSAKPLAQAYRNVTPQVVDDAITNVFSNLGEPFVMVNNLAQGKFIDALSDAGRFIVNSTVGVLGIFDVARHLGMPKHNEDIGQTLAFWGVESGPYIVLPVLGPSTIRDASGFAIEIAAFDMIDPQSQSLENTELYYSSVFIEYLDIRADIIPAEGIISGDKYSFLRTLYLQRREFLINDGQVKDEFGEFDEEFDDF
ncbi:VacJ family lipoprotein [Oceaniserpentilla sp. 4NH20-0058]|uniref:MlaA family lipoprotein n=1 Tax=Oceaniserpentilla sp. 4NH20-0058 TaxID=3127660 RepID=UPI003102C336